MMPYLFDKAVLTNKQSIFVLPSVYRLLPPNNVLAQLRFLRRTTQTETSFPAG